MVKNDLALGDRSGGRTGTCLELSMEELGREDAYVGVNLPSQ